MLMRAKLIWSSEMRDHTHKMADAGSFCFSKLFLNISKINGRIAGINVMLVYIHSQSQLR